MKIYLVIPAHGGQLTAMQREQAGLRATVGQFTGLCDAEGREVYEGDILRGRWNEFNRDVSGPVIFGGGAFKARLALLGATGTTYDFSKFRVVGTIHDPKPEKA